MPRVHIQIYNIAGKNYYYLASIYNCTTRGGIWHGEFPSSHIRGNQRSDKVSEKKREQQQTRGLHTAQKRFH